jgi:hypothetical protein
MQHKSFETLIWNTIFETLILKSLNMKD